MTPEQAILQYLEQRADHVASWAKVYRKPSEIERIVSVPVSYPLTPEEQEALSSMLVLPSAFREGFRFRPRQGDAIQTFLEHGRGFFPMPVGGGKTLTGIVAAEQAIVRGYAKKVLLVLPSNLTPQYLDRDLPLARQWVQVSFRLRVLHGENRKQRRTLAQDPRPGVFLWTYGLMSEPTAEEELSWISPDLIICDEAHKLARRGSGRTRRIFRYLEKNPHVRFVCMSGTVSQRSVNEYNHLAYYSLKEYSFLPKTKTETDNMAALLDSSAEEPGHNPEMQYMKPLVNWARQYYPNLQYNTAGIRAAYYLRMASTPGVVVASGREEIGSSLVVKPHKVPFRCDLEHEKLAGLINDVSRAIDPVSPNGDPISHAILAYKCLFELYAGGYNELYWPEDADPEILERSQLYLYTAREYGKTLRKWFGRFNRPGLDTPWLVQTSMDHHGHRDVGAELYESYTLLKEADFEGRIERSSRYIRVCPYKIEAAIEQARHHPKGCVVWAINRGLVLWTYELFCEAFGPDKVGYFPAGPEADQRLQGESLKGKHLICSLPAHNEGKNLQHYHDAMIYVQFPRSPNRVEQSLGRVHRHGQKADEVTAHLLLSGPFDEMQVAAAMDDSVYIKQTQGGEPKILFANWDPLPHYYPTEALKDNGFQPKRASRNF